MADENVPALALTRFDDQILPFAAWVPIGKSNFVLDLQKNFQLDESRFLLDAYLPREALKIKPIDQAHQFVSPPLGDAIIEFVNELGYTEKIHFVSRMVVNNLYRPYRAILSMINQCLTSKTSGFDMLRYPVLQMLWGIVTSTNVDYAKLMLEEFVQAMQTFLVDKANLSIAPQKGKKTKPHVIPYCQFTKLIICHLGRTHSLHQRSASPFHLAEKDLKLGNLKFVPKGEDDEVFGMLILNEMITNNIRNVPYYNAYLEMPAKEKSSKPAPAPKPKVTKEKPSNPSHAKHPKRDKVQKLRKGKTPLQLIDEDEPTQPQPEPEPEHHGEGEEYDVERAIQMSLESFPTQSQAHVGGAAIREPVEEATRPLPMVKGKGKAIAIEEQAAQSLLALHMPKRRSVMD
ncbi:hypothetical protein Tco_1426459 [Tanacetum coccineum]